MTDLDAIDRMVAEAEAAPILWTSRAAFLWNAYPAIAAELREARKRVRELEAEIEVRDNSANETLRILREALPNRGFHSDMEAAEAAKKELEAWRNERQMTLTAFAHVRDGGNPRLIGHPNGSEFGGALRSMLAARDRRMKALGAAQWLESTALENVALSPEDLRVNAAQLYRLAELEAAGEGEGNGN